MTVKEKKGKEPVIYMVSGGSGASGNQILNTALAQFPGCIAQVINVPYIRSNKDVDDFFNKRYTNGPPVIHTLVNSDIRVYLMKRCKELEIYEIDLMGNVLNLLKKILNENPVCKPGLYHELNQDYFRRAEAIEFTMSHDDGQKPEELTKAEIVITAISRVGKTPLSVYLSTLGWKVANVPIIMGSPIPEELLIVEKARVFGLLIDPERVVSHRQMRKRSLGATDMTSYTSLSGIFEEMEYARSIFKKRGFRVIDITDKPVETIAEEIVGLIMKRFKKKAHKQKHF
jgi:regulator of PEP synthase PpsR (kinase-PPPase family)